MGLGTPFPTLSIPTPPLAIGSNPLSSTTGLGSGAPHDSVIVPSKRLAAAIKLV